MMEFSDIVRMYPYLSDKNISYVYEPTKDRGFVEFYSPTEPGSKEYPRPKSLPMGGVGIQVLSKDAKPIDVLGDYVSHWGVYTDPFLKRTYQDFVNSLDDKQLNTLEKQYKYSQENFGENRPFSQWLEITGLPGYFRGYTFNQWENPEDMYRKDQLKLLDNVRSYLGITPSEMSELGDSVGYSVGDSVDD